MRTKTIGSPSVTVSGSFRRHLAQIATDVSALTDAGAVVLSPADPRVVDAFGDFLFVASDHHRTVRRLQDRHLAAIEASTFLWVVDPDGYVGTSTALEIGAAVALGIPVYSLTPPSDLTLRQYVELVPTLAHAVAEARHRGAPGPAVKSILLSPAETLEEAHRSLEALGRRLTSVDTTHRERDLEVVAAAERVRNSLRHL